MIVGKDVAGRVLRVSWHPVSDRLVLSVWQDGGCLATVRLAGQDVGRLADVLSGLAEGRRDPVHRAG